MRALRRSACCLALGWLVALSLACGPPKSAGDAGASGGAGGGSGAAGGMGGGGGTGGGSDAGQPTLGFITAVDLHAALQAKNFLLIDVHTPRAGVVPGTDTSIVYSDMAGLVAYIGADLHRKVVLTCLSGGMSTTAGQALVARGYDAISSLQGGMSAWTAAGYTLNP